MSRLRLLVMSAVVVACGVGTFFSADRNYRPIARIDSSQKLTKFAGSSQESTVPAEPLDGVRKAELSRRATRPAGDPRREGGKTYDGVLNGGKTRPHPRAAEPMPPTYCRSIERAPSHTAAFYGQHHVHYLTLRLFESASGFGDRRMQLFTNDRGASVASPAIERVELVSLLTDDEPSVYVLDEMATPALARQTKRRPLDEFERLGLDALRRGEELVWTREATTRMLGEICAKASCLHCHADAKEGDLLGAFTYYLKVPVDRLNTRGADGKRRLELDPATKLICDRLQDKIDLRFEKTSLEDVFNHIKSATRRGPNDRDIWIYVDPMGLVEAEKTLATPVSFTAKGEPLKSSLERLLKSMSLTYMVKDGYLLVTSRD
jgi:hypothetical protein